jgi:PPM family protein phosphatase
VNYPTDARRLRVSVASERGYVREQNEDMAVVGERLLRDTTWVDDSILTLTTRPLIVGVCDGMGGHRGGGLASAHVAMRLAEVVGRWAPDLSGAEVVLGLRQAVLDVHRELMAIGGTDADVAEAGATLTALVFTARVTALVHLGDSRAYRLREGFLTRLTSDHTLHSEGIVEAPRHVITNAVGGHGRCHPFVEEVTDRLLPEDTVLLTTDGVANDDVPDDDIGAALKAGPAVQALIALALARGGVDNATAVRVDLLT